MSFEPLQIGLFILMFVPGYIFIQIIDHYLLKGEKSQFEKTIQVLFTSTVIWLFVFVWPWFIPVQKQKEAVIGIIKQGMINNKQREYFVSEIINSSEKVTILFIFVCIYAFLGANLWGYLRRTKKIDNFIRAITKRDWYKTVSLRFFDENIDSTILITTKDKRRYIGILNGAPDDKTDNHIIIVDPYYVEEKKFVKLAAVSTIINIDDIELIEVIKKK